MSRRKIRVRWFNTVSLWGFRDTFEEQEHRYARKEDAVWAARYLARGRWRNNGELTQLIVCGKNGRIQYENTYGKDPRRSKG